MGKLAIFDPSPLPADRSSRAYGQQSDRIAISGMRCGWGAGCLRPATLVWLRGKSFANALCREHSDSLRLVLPQAHLVRWSGAENGHWTDPSRARRSPGDR